MNTLYKTLIIDDEPPARLRLQKLLMNFTETFQIIGFAEDGLDAKEKIETLQPDLIFLDIEMPEMSGFEMLTQLTKIPIVVFCTAYNQYSLQAFETNSIDYLLKPVRLKRLQQTVDKLKLFSKNTTSENVLQLLKELSLKKEEKKMTSLTVKKGEKLIFLKLDDISLFKADERYVSVIAKEETYLIEDALFNLEKKLPDNFIRIHRGIIINKNFVNDIQKYFNSRFIITLKNTKQKSVTSGRSYNKAIKKWINN